MRIRIRARNRPAEAVRKPEYRQRRKESKKLYSRNAKHPAREAAREVEPI
jgi:hypothetical protein